jgi:hypothetical protein
MIPKLTPRQQLKQYRQLGREIILLEQQLHTRQPGTDIVTDTVKGSMPEYPYIETVVKITGINQRTVERLQRRYHRIKAEREAIETLIDSIADSYIRNIITLRYVQGEGWDTVAAKSGKNVSPDSVRKALDRYLQKSLRLSTMSVFSML